MRLFLQLHSRFPSLYLKENFDFSRHTTIGCGGRAKVAAYPTSVEESAALLAFLQRERIPVCFLGAGANVLPSDEDFDGVVVLFHKLNALYADDTVLYAGAGVTGGAFLRYAWEHGIGGFSAFSGIPMTVGGAITMNAGIKQLHCSDVVRRVLCVESGKLRTLESSDCDFGEKYSIFQNGIAVLGAYFQGKSALPDVIAKESCYFRSLRAHLPKGRSMGCTFVNPKHCCAGQLIEQCHLKNARVGGAVVSPLHANFIINEHGTATDVAMLINLVKQVVKAQTGVDLREEIRRI